MTGAPVETPEPRKRGKLRTAGLGCLGLIAILVVIGIISSLTGGGDEETPAKQVAAAAPTATAAPTVATLAATKASAQSAPTVAPTKAAQPTPTTKAAPTAVPTKAPAKPAGPLPIGQMAKVGDVEVTVPGARWDGPAASDGTRTLLVEASVHYVGADKYNLSSILQTSLFGSDNRKADITISLGAKGSLDGTLTPDQTQVGEVAFKVNPDAGPFRFRFAKAFATDLAEWTIPAPQ